VPFIVLAACGTVTGALFTHYVLFPAMVAFFGTLDVPHMRLLPRVEDTFGLYKNVLIGMVVVFQIPTLVFFLARLGMVTPRFLWKQVRYAVLISFVAAALLTPSPDPWNQAIFALPMMALYVVSIGIAWVVAPRPSKDDDGSGARNLKLVFAATVLHEATRRDRAPAAYPRLWRGAR
jgi:sec-independent protein translocase protein TatC